jgi:hypothetical protein
MNASSWSARYKAAKDQQRKARDEEPRAPERCRYPLCCAVQMIGRLHCAYHAALYTKACAKLAPGIDADAFLRRWGL